MNIFRIPFTVLILALGLTACDQDVVVTHKDGDGFGNDSEPLSITTAEKKNKDIYSLKVTVEWVGAEELDLNTQLTHPCNNSIGFSTDENVTSFTHCQGFFGQISSARDRNMSSSVLDAGLNNSTHYGQLNLDKDNNGQSDQGVFYGVNQVEWSLDGVPNGEFSVFLNAVSSESVNTADYVISVENNQGDIVQFNGMIDSQGEMDNIVRFIVANEGENIVKIQ